MYDILELSNKLLPELRDIARELKIKRTESLKKQDLIYKILDQQAIEATEKRKIINTDTNPANPLKEMENQQYDPVQRRGKRPRTQKPVINRPVESVISVSPDDLKNPDPVIFDQRESTVRPERPDEKPDLFKSKEPVKEEIRTPIWKREQNFSDRKERDRRFNEKPFAARDTKKPEICS